MKTIQINYDLVAPGRDYQALYDYIRSHDGYATPLESLWLIRTNKTAFTVRDELIRLVDANDKVATFDVTGDEWGTNFSNAHTDWMQRNMETTPAVRSAA